MQNSTYSDWCATKMIGRVQVAMFFSYETLPYHGVQQKNNQLQLMHLEMEEPMKLAVDNILALNQAKNSVAQGRSKHRDKIALLERPCE